MFLDGFTYFFYVQEEYIRIPYGDCMDATLRHFGGYSVRSCQSDCELRYLKRICNCTLIYYPAIGDIISRSRLCFMSKFSI